jgi:hypothetical protein
MATKDGNPTFYAKNCRLAKAAPVVTATKDGNPTFYAKAKLSIGKSGTSRYSSVLIDDLLDHKMTYPRVDQIDSFQKNYATD